MMVFLSVLKMIGLVLLCILLFILLILVIVLFVPLRYRLAFSSDSDSERYGLELHVTWLLSILHGVAWYKIEGEKDEEKPFGYELRALWFKLFKKDDSEEGEEETVEYLPEEHIEEAWTEEVEKRVEEPLPELEEEPQEEPEKTGTEEPEDKESEDLWEEEDEKKSFRDQVKEFVRVLKRIFKKIHDIKNNARYEIKEKYDKIKRLYHRAEHLKDTLESERFEEAFDRSLKELIRILKDLKPSGYRVDLTYGFDDPALTGEVTGLIAAFFPFSRGRSNLLPDFDRKVLKGEGFIKGSMRLFTFLIVLWMLYFNKSIRWTIRELKK